MFAILLTVIGKKKFITFTNNQTKEKKIENDSYLEIDS